MRAKKVSLSFVFILCLSGLLGASSILTFPLPPVQHVAAQAGRNNAAPSAQAQGDGVTYCYNYKHDGKKPNCKCWGNANPNQPINPNCKPPNGEDVHCTNHCRKDLCKCKMKCQS